jgi:hypothetical protein
MKIITYLLLFISSIVQAQYNDPIDILQASAMPYKAGGSPFGFNNDYYQFLSNGFISDSVYFPTSEMYQFDVSAWSNYSHKQWGNLEIKIDNVPTVDMPINQKTLSFFSLRFPVSAGLHKVSIGLTNHNSLTNVKLKLGLIYISKMVFTGLIYRGNILDSEEGFFWEPATNSSITVDQNGFLIFNTDSGFLTIDKWTGGHLRGFNEGSEGNWHPVVESNYRDLAATGANLIRHHFTIILNKATDSYELEQGDITRFDSILSWAEKYKFYVNIGFDQDPHASDQLWWGSKHREQSIVSLWKQIAARYSNNKRVAAYSPLNEPTPAGRVGEYIKWMNQICDTIVSVDSVHCIVFPWAHDYNIYDMMLPLPHQNIVYEYHMYDPFEITSQGINGFTQSKIYPSSTYTKIDLNAKLDKLRAFRDRWNVPIYVGEAGCVRYAPRNTTGESSSDRWYKDAISIFESESIPYTITSWRQSEIWDVQISSYRFYTCPYKYAEPTCNFGTFDAYRSDTTSVMIELKNQFLKNK